MKKLIAALWFLAFPALAANYSSPTFHNVTAQGTITAPALSLTGSGSTGDISAMGSTATGGSVNRTLASRAADLWDIKEENPACDGTTDDSSALAAALTAAGTAKTLVIDCPLYLGPAATISQPSGGIIQFQGNGEIVQGFNSVSAINIINPGSGYNGSYTASITGNAVLGAPRLKAVSVSIVTNGSGCTTGQTLYPAASAGGTQYLGTALVVEAVNGSGGVTNLFLRAPGQWAPPPANPVLLDYGNGSCTVYPTVNITWGLSYIPVTSGGSYSGTAIPAVTISGAAPTVAGNVVAAGKAITLKGNIVSGSRQIFSGAENITGPLQNAAINLRWFTPGDGTSDDTSGLQAAANTTNNIMAPSGNYVLSSQVNFSTIGQAFTGAGKGSTIFNIKALPTLTTAGYFDTSAIDQTFDNFQIDFTQPDTSTYANIIKYPAAFYSSAYQNNYINLRIERAFDGIDIPVGDRSRITDLDMSNFHTGIAIYDSYDLITIQNADFWTWGLTGNQTTLYENNTVSNPASDILGNPQLPVKVYVEHADLLQIIGGLSFGGTTIDTNTSPTSTAPYPTAHIEAVSLSCDSPVCVQEAGGDIDLLSGTVGHGTSASPLVHNGGNLSLRSVKITTTGAGNPAYPSIVSTATTSGSTLSVQGSVFDDEIGDTNNVFDLTDISSTGTASINVTGNTFMVNPTINKTKPTISITGASATTITGNNFNPATTGSGTAISVGNLSNINVHYNATNGRTVTITGTNQPTN